MTFDHLTEAELSLDALLFNKRFLFERLREVQAYRQSLPAGHPNRQSFRFRMIKIRVWILKNEIQLEKHLAKTGYSIQPFVNILNQTRHDDK